ncbi:MAG: ATP-binding protein [Acidobacteriota bacterium]|nr:ATP-binding protein [Acidobacteriota bacterium]
MALSRAISNVVRNAVRYAGRAGEIEISASNDNGQIQLKLADNGAGVPESELDKLFDPFYRIQADRARETGGVGLGLAIVKTCIESCGGLVSAHNRTPHGLEVVIQLQADRN